MSKFTITINTDGAAFEEFPTGELRRILLKFAEDLHHYAPEDFECARPLRDSNGNTVGEAEYVEDQA